MIELEVINDSPSQVKFRISAQTLVRQNFMDKFGRLQWTASNCWTICLFYYPEVSTRHRCFYLRGLRHEKDSVILRATRSDFEEIQSALKELEVIFADRPSLEEEFFQRCQP